MTKRKQQPTCSTPCLRDTCTQVCHNDHVPMINRRHSPSQCPAVGGEQ